MSAQADRSETRGREPGSLLGSLLGRSPCAEARDIHQAALFVVKRSIAEIPAEDLLQRGSQRRRQCAGRPIRSPSSMDRNWTQVTPSEFPWEREALDVPQGRACPTTSPIEPGRTSSSCWTARSARSTCWSSRPKGSSSSRSRAGRARCAATPGPGATRRPDDVAPAQHGQPAALTNRKAKRLKSLLARQRAFRGQRVPFVAPLVFLSHPELDCRLDPTRARAFMASARGRAGERRASAAVCRESSTPRRTHRRGASAPRPPADRQADGQAHRPRSSRPASARRSAAARSATSSSASSSTRAPATRTSPASTRASRTPTGACGSTARPTPRSAASASRSPAPRSGSSSCWHPSPTPGSSARWHSTSTSSARRSCSSATRRRSASTTSSSRRAARCRSSIGSRSSGRSPRRVAYAHGRRVCLIAPCRRAASSSCRPARRQQRFSIINWQTGSRGSGETLTGTIAGTRARRAARRRATRRPISRPRR